MFIILSIASFPLIGWGMFSSFNYCDSFVTKSAVNNLISPHGKDLAPLSANSLDDWEEVIKQAKSEEGKSAVRWLQSQLFHPSESVNLSSRAVNFSQLRDQFKVIKQLDGKSLNKSFIENFYKEINGSTPKYRKTSQSFNIDEKHIWGKIEESDKLNKTAKGYAFTTDPRAGQELLEETLKDYQSLLASANTIEKKVILHSELAWNLMRQSPFESKNYETTATLLSNLLAKEGFVPPVINLDDALYLSQSDFVERVVLGMQTSKALMHDASRRISMGLDIADSPAVYMRFLNKDVETTGNVARANGLIDIDPLDFAFFSRHRSNSEEGYKNLVEAYEKHVSKMSVRFENSAKEIDKYQLKFIPEERFAKHFDIDAIDAKAWTNKMDQFYEKDLLFRGDVSYSQLSDQKILTFFSQTKREFLSMRAQYLQGFFAKFLAKWDMRIFNRLLKSDVKNLFSYIYDHMTMGKKYWSSFFLSTSKNEKTARRFAKGFMKAEKDVLKQKSQIVVGFKTPKHGSADLNRLSHVAKKQDPAVSFGSKYARQEEVSVAGSIAPDSVMEVKVNDVVVTSVDQNSGENIAGTTEVLRKRVFRRNAEKPDRIEVLEYNDKDELLGSKTYQMKKNFLGMVSFNEI